MRKSGCRWCILYNCITVVSAAAYSKAIIRHRLKSIYDDKQLHTSMWIHKPYSVKWLRCPSYIFPVDLVIISRNHVKLLFNYILKSNSRFEAILLFKACSNLFLFKYVQWNARLTCVPPRNGKTEVSVSFTGN